MHYHTVVLREDILRRTRDIWDKSRRVARQGPTKRLPLIKAYQEPRGVSAHRKGLSRCGLGLHR